MVEVVVMDCNVANNNYQQLSNLLFTFAPNNQVAPLIIFSPHSLPMSKLTTENFHLLLYG